MQDAGKWKVVKEMRFRDGDVTVLGLIVRNNTTAWLGDGLEMSISSWSVDLINSLSDFRSLRIIGHVIVNHYKTVL